MAVFPVRFFGDPVIREKSLKVIKLDKEVSTLCRNMADTMYESQGVGLAAPQIGILKQIIVIGMDDESFVAYVNPKIVEYLGPEETDEEGCLCLPDIRVPVRRSRKVVVEALDLKGRELELEAEDMLARILQHEIDHLDGLTILDRTEAGERRRAIGEFMERHGNA